MWTCIIGKTKSRKNTVKTANFSRENNEIFNAI